MTLPSIHAAPICRGIEATPLYLNSFHLIGRLAPRVTYYLLAGNLQRTVKLMCTIEFFLRIFVYRVEAGTAFPTRWLIIVLTGHQSENDNAAAFPRAARGYNNVWSRFREIYNSRAAIASLSLTTSSEGLVSSVAGTQSEDARDERRSATCNFATE